MIEYKRIKDLREDNDYTQDYVAEYLKVNRSSYANWENGDNIIPLDILDKLTLLYNVPIAYFINKRTHYDKSIKIKPINYEVLLNKINWHKEENNLSYQDIANFLKVSKSTAYKYYTGQYIITIDILVLLAELTKYNIDELCGKI
ncbi:MAG: XRE family transcriptional regulator [Bacilli bacterium]|nr:XRE family transcriptional regulator [Bacilli bacterium]